MTPTNRQIAEDFSSHRFDAALPYLSEDVRWTLVGGSALVGRAAVAAVCKRSAAELAGVTVEYERFKVIVGDDGVVVDSIARYGDANGDATVVSSCDVYEFTGAAVTAITSYAVDLQG